MSSKAFGDAFLGFGARRGWLDLDSGFCGGDEAVEEIVSGWPCSKSESRVEAERRVLNRAGRVSCSCWMSSGVLGSAFAI
jgi:hypothetical protein